MYKYWPCCPSKDAPLTVVCCHDMFFIPDHPHLLEVFDHVIPVLDLTPMQVGKLKDLFLALGLMNRFLSGSETEIASATDTSSLNHGYIKQYARKSNGLVLVSSWIMQFKVIVLRYLSCAVHFGSERATDASELQRLLQEVNIYRASDILTKI